MLAQTGSLCQHLPMDLRDGPDPSPWLFVPTPPHGLDPSHGTAGAGSLGRLTTHHCSASHGTQSPDAEAETETETGHCGAERD